MMKIKSKSQFPDFDKMTLEEEALWWESHDLSEIWHDLDEIEVQYEPDTSKTKGHYKTSKNPVKRANEMSQ